MDSRFRGNDKLGGFEMNSKKVPMGDINVTGPNRVPPLPEESAPLAGEIQNLSWKDLGLGASPRDFDLRCYAFRIQENPAAPEVFGPRHLVILAGHPERIIPWTDPYLLMEWRAFLRERGVEITEDQAKGKKCYRYKGRLLLEEERTPEQATFRWFHPSGKLRDEIIYPLASKPKVTVSALPDKETYLVSVYNRPLRMEVHGPANPPSDDLTKSLACAGEILQKIPESMIAPMLTGDRAESPLILRASSPEHAKQKGWLGRAESWAGKYFDGKNILWSNIADSCDQDHLFHEVGGHVYDDFAAADINSAGLVEETGRSALRDYFAWKLSRLFAPEELAAYNAATVRLRQWRLSEKQDPQEKKNLDKILAPFREKALRGFVSSYAIEGGYSIHGELAAPTENFAEVMRVFFTSLEGGADWSSSSDKEPLLTLVGMDYLFHEYGAARIGTIGREEVYSKKAFQTVLGIDVEQIRKPKDFRQGWTFAVTGGFQLSSPAAQGESISVDPAGMVRGGYRVKEFGGGLSLGYAFQDSRPLDAGLWGHAHWDLTPPNSGTLRGVTLFGGPTLGIRNYLSENRPASFWAGANAGIGIFGGALSLISEGKVGATPLEEWQSLTLGIQFDPTLSERSYQARKRASSYSYLLED
jgi:hypothetical protein